MFINAYTPWYHLLGPTLSLIQQQCCYVTFLYQRKCNCINFQLQRFPLHCYLDARYTWLVNFFVYTYDVFLSYWLFFLRRRVIMTMRKYKAFSRHDCHVTLDLVQSSTVSNEKKWVNMLFLFCLMCNGVCNVFAWSRNAFLYPIRSCVGCNICRLFLVTI